MNRRVLLNELSGLSVLIFENTSEASRISLPRNTYISASKHVFLCFKIYISWHTNAYIVVQKYIFKLRIRNSLTNSGHFPEFGCRLLANS